MIYFLFKACPACRGDLRYDEGDGEWVCMQGGHRFPATTRTPARTYGGRPPGEPDTPAAARIRRWRHGTPGGYRPDRPERPGAG